MVVKKLEIIPKPEEGTRAVLTKDMEEPYFKGDGDIDLACGNCNAILAEGVLEGTLRNLVLYCNKCGSYNNIL